MRFFCRPYGDAVYLNKYPFVVLWNDNWDDYHFRTTFRAELYLGKNDVADLGQVKILPKGLPRSGGEVKLPKEFESLRPEYCALGQTFTYYETLKDLGAEIYEPVLTGLRDVIYIPHLLEEFAEEPGFEVSLLRGSSAVRVLEDAPRLFWHGASPLGSDLSEISFAVKTRVGGSSFEIAFNYGDRKSIPNRINAIIGYNGVGKTRLLANLAMLASADQDRQAQADFQLSYGSFLGDAPRFGSTIAVSYSAFDTFEIPASNAEQRSLKEQAGELQGYTYCGLRELRSRDNESTFVAPADHVQLKSTREITEDFFDALLRAQAESRRKILERALKTLLLEPSFSRAKLDSFFEGVGEHPEIRHQLGSFSTGHKIVLNIIVQLVANLQMRSLVLIDEPESHLHPPLLAALLRSISVALEARDSVAVVATHSPVVLQEIPRRYVRVLRRDGQRTSVSTPESETFGENVGFLTRTVFNLDSSQTDYQRVLANLAQRFSLEEIETMFDGQISGQARAYIIAQQRRRA